MSRKKKNKKHQSQQQRAQQLQQYQFRRKYGNISASEIARPVKPVHLSPPPPPTPLEQQLIDNQIARSAYSPQPSHRSDTNSSHGSLFNSPAKISRLTDSSTTEEVIDKDSYDSYDIHDDYTSDNYNTSEYTELNLYVDITEEMIHEALVKYMNLRESGYQSMAMYELEDSIGGVPMIDDIRAMDEPEQNATFIALTNFLNAPDSTVEGARFTTLILKAQQYEGKFGNQYSGEKYSNKHYDDNYINDDLAKLAFKTYRMVAETKAAQAIGIGSENLITQIYTYVTEGHYNPDQAASFFVENLDRIYLQTEGMKFATLDFEDNEDGYIISGRPPRR